MAEVMRYSVLVSAASGKEEVIGIFKLGTASNRDCFEADGGKLVQVPDDEYHSTYNMMRDGKVVGSYTTWCGRQPCYHEDIEDLVRLSSEVRERLAEKGLSVLRDAEGAYAVPSEVLALAEMGRETMRLIACFLKKQVSFSDLREAVKAAS